ncbi:hypothetical protein L484_019555 [Morus notabilis]|uniref:Uncharacterized protein n=1 Tax=Morus notabilis TaxID=981085 RepID=W9RVX4_9ROSA|nr:hypothetical protein L484_019555 [Morus notabilis]
MEPASSKRMLFLDAIILAHMGVTNDGDLASGRESPSVEPSLELSKTDLGPLNFSVLLNMLRVFNHKFPWVFPFA